MLDGSEWQKPSVLESIITGSEGFEVSILMSRRGNRGFVFASVIVLEESSLSMCMPRRISGVIAMGRTAKLE